MNCNTLSTNPSLLIYLSWVFAFLTFKIPPLHILDCILRDMWMNRPTLSQFACLPLLMKPYQQVAMDVQAVIFAIIFEFFALGHVLFYFFMHVWVFKNLHIKTRIMQAQISHFLAPARLSCQFFCNLFFEIYELPLHCIIQLTILLSTFQLFDDRYN